MEKAGKSRIFGKGGGNACKRTCCHKAQLAGVRGGTGEECVPRLFLTVNGIFRKGKLHIAQTVFAVEGGGNPELFQKRLFRPAIDRIVCAHEAVDALRIAEGIFQRGIAADGRDAAEINLRERMGKHQSDGIIDTGIAVDPYRNVLHIPTSLKAETASIRQSINASRFTSIRQRALGAWPVTPYQSGTVAPLQ